jgi:hypothetical protein
MPPYGGAGETLPLEGAIEAGSKYLASQPIRLWSRPHQLNAYIMASYSRSIAGRPEKKNKVRTPDETRRGRCPGARAVGTAGGPEKCAFVKDVLRLMPRSITARPIFRPDWRRLALTASTSITRMSAVRSGR